MREYRSTVFERAQRDARLSSPEYWECNATLHTHKPFREAWLNYAKKLREQANG